MQALKSFHPLRVVTVSTRLIVPVTSLALMLLLLWVAPINDFFVCGSWMAGNHLPPSVVASLVLLSWLIQPLLRKIGSGWSSAEWALMVSILLPTAGLASSGLMRHLIPLIAAPRYFARQTPELLPDRLPQWLYLSDVDAVRAFYENTPMAASEWAKVWLTPLLSWGILVACLWVGCWALMEPLWRQWAQRERFAFPIPHLLHHLLADEPAITFKRQKLFWSGIAVCGIVHGINLANAYAPSVPSLPLRFTLTPQLTQLPWSALAPLEFHVYLSAIGMSFWIAGDVAIGFAAFYWLAKMQRLIAAWWGWHPIVSFGRGLPIFIAAQQIGATIALALAIACKLVLLTRADSFVGKQLKVWFICCCGIAVWSWWVGIPLWLSWLIAVGYFVLAIVVAWAVTNAGLLFVQTTFVPAEIGLLFRGTDGVPASTTAALALQQWALMFNFRDHPLPHLLHGRHLAHLTALPITTLRGWQGVGLAMGSLWAAISFLATMRRYGALRLCPFDFVQLPQTVFRIAHAWWTQPLLPQWQQISWGLLGALLWQGISSLRSFYHWFPNPIGWLFAESYAAQMFWLSFALGAAAKFVAVRYGGLRTYQRWRPLFAGMIVSDALMAAASSVISWHTPIRYAVLPT